jgi:RHS repeat-associated protein
MTQPLACLFSAASAHLPSFTGKERDTESGNDYFSARYYASSMGRWLSPDWASNPVTIPFGNVADPQSLNLYSYVGNNPLVRIDPFGHSKDCGGGGDPSVVCMVTTAWDWLKGHLGGSTGNGAPLSPDNGDGLHPVTWMTIKPYVPQTFSLNLGVTGDAGLGAGFGGTAQASLLIDLKDSQRNVYGQVSGGGTYVPFWKRTEHQSPDPKDWVWGFMAEED